MHAVTQGELDKLAWFHGIDFGGGLSVNGRIPKSQPQNYTLFNVYPFLEHIDLRECRIIDIGTADGLMAFISKKLGGKEVVAGDLFDRRAFRLARRLLGYEDKIEYRTNVDISQLHTIQHLGEGTFDLAVFCGVLYHLMSPLESLLICRQPLPRG